MSVLLEAIVLPALFLTVALLGGLRIGASVQFVPPPLMALVLALVLVASLARAGVLRADGLMHSSRSAVENLSGLVVLLSLFAASAQVLHLLTPDTGLLHVAFSVILFVQLLSTMAAGTGRVGLLRSLVVLFGSAFVLRWIVLESLYAPEGGALKRVLTILAEGLTLGTLGYLPNAAVTGYVALLALVLYMAGVALLAPAPSRDDLRIEEVRLTRSPGTDIVGLVLLTLVASACGTAADSPASGGRATAAVDAGTSEAERARLLRVRTDALRSARVWMPPAVPVSEADLAANPGMGIVDVVTQHQDEVESQSLAPRGHLAGDCVLPLVASTGIANDRKPHRAILQGECQLARSGGELANRRASRAIGARRQRGFAARRGGQRRQCQDDGASNPRG